jgi:hypothetical protein
VKRVFNKGSSIARNIDGLPAGKTPAGGPAPLPAAPPCRRLWRGTRGYSKVIVRSAEPSKVKTDVNPPTLPKTGEEWGTPEAWNRGAKTKGKTKGKTPTRILKGGGFATHRQPQTKT